MRPHRGETRKLADGEEEDGGGNGGDGEDRKEEDQMVDGIDEGTESGRQRGWVEEQQE